MASEENIGSMPAAAPPMEAEKVEPAWHGITAEIVSESEASGDVDKGPLLQHPVIEEQTHRKNGNTEKKQNEEYVGKRIVHYVSPHKRNTTAVSE